MTVDEILVETTKKLLALDKLEDWKDELLSKAPPVLWFGNSKSENDKVLTIGANPSRWEFLDQKLQRVGPSPYQKVCYENYYLSNQRFCHLSDTESYEDIIKDKDLRDKIIYSFDNYFNANPYRWFGSDKDNSYNVEGVLRGMFASFFNTDSRYTACHIDLFPFATIRDFNKIQVISRDDIFINSWAKNIVDELLGYFNPKIILVFGRTNFNYLLEFFKIPRPEGVQWQAAVGNGKCYYWQTWYGGYKILALSVNLGNPKGFNAVGLKELGEHLRMQFNL